MIAIPTFRLGYPEETPRLAFGDPPPVEKALTERYRPQTLADLVGQGPVVWQLQSFVEAPYPTAFLFEGPTGVGKTSAALALANELGVDPFWGLHHIKSGEQDAEAVETALKSLRFVAAGGSGWKLVLVDEADYMSVKAAQLWLSALENLPPKSIIIFTTNHGEKIERQCGARFLDRCEWLQFQGDADLLLQDAQALINSIWHEETGAMADAPDARDLPSLVDSRGIISFRRAVRALEPMLRDRKAQRDRGPRDAAPDDPPATPPPSTTPSDRSGPPPAPEREPEPEPDPDPRSATVEFQTPLAKLQLELAELEDRYIAVGHQVLALEEAMREIKAKIKAAKKQPKSKAPARRRVKAR